MTKSKGKGKEIKEKSRPMHKPIDFSTPILPKSEAKTSEEIIDKWKNLQLLLIKRKGEIYPHEKFEQKQWLPVDKAISLEIHKKLQDSEFNLRKKLIKFENKSILIDDVEKILNNFYVIFRYCSECKTYRLLEPNCKHEYVYRHKIRYIHVEDLKQKLKTLNR